jgi:hypothetical protein
MKPAPEILDLASVVERVSRLQKRAPNGLTNYFRQSLSATAFQVHETERSLCFLFSEGQFARLYFFTADLADLTAWLRDFQPAQATVISWVARGDSPDVRACLESAGFRYYDTFLRMICRQLPAMPCAVEPEFATESEAVDLRRRMATDFDPYTNHFPTLAELGTFAANRWIIVRRHDGRITGYILFRPKGRSVFFNYLFNDSAFPHDALMLFGQFFHALRRLGATSSHIWVKHDNRRVVKLYQAFGWSFDGLASQYFVKPPSKVTSCG